jgi:hypothetical protein
MSSSAARPWSGRSCSAISSPMQHWSTTDSALVKFQGRAVARREDRHRRALICRGTALSERADVAAADKRRWTEPPLVRWRAVLFLVAPAPRARRTRVSSSSRLRSSRKDLLGSQMQPAGERGAMALEESRRQPFDEHRHGLQLCGSENCCVVHAEHVVELVRAKRLDLHRAEGKFAIVDGDYRAEVRLVELDIGSLGDVGTEPAGHGINGKDVDRAGCAARGPGTARWRSLRRPGGRECNRLRGESGGGGTQTPPGRPGNDRAGSRGGPPAARAASSARPVSAPS